MLLLIVLIFFFALAASLALWWIKGSKNVAIIVFLVCFLGPSWNLILGLISFNYLCCTESGKKVYKTVKDVEGYLSEDTTWGCNDGCIDELLKKQHYKFIEANVTKPDPKFLTNEIGFYRFYPDKKGALLCNAYYEMVAMYHPNYQKKYYEEHPEDICVASERIDRLKSKYAYYHYDSQSVSIAPLRIRKLKSSVRNIETNETLGEAVSFLWYGPSWLEIFVDHVKPAECPVEVFDRNKPGIHYAILKETLVPKEDK